MNDRTPDEKLNGEEARAALVARLAHFSKKTKVVRPPQSLQQSREAAKSGVTRFPQKQRLLQKSNRSRISQPPARDPLSP